MLKVKKKNRRVSDRANIPRKYTECTILQINVDRKRAAHDALYSIATRRNADVLVVAEPNKKLSKQQQWYVDERGDAAIAVLNRTIVVKEHGGGKGYVWVDLGGAVLYSCYASPNTTYNVFGQYLWELSESLKTRRGKVVLAGDLNAKSSLWGSRTDNRRGDALAEFAVQHQLVVLNDGIMPTFIRGQQYSHIDITLCGAGLAASSSVGGWQVTDEETLGCHQCIEFCMHRVATVEETRPSTSGRAGWRYSAEGGANFKKYIRRVRDHENKEDVDAEGLVRIITDACDETLDRKKGPVRGKKPVYWWSEDIACARRACITARRQMTRANAQMTSTTEDRAHAEEMYKQARRVYTKMIRAAKKEAWKKLVTELDSDIWGRGYQLVTRKLVGGKRGALGAEEIKKAVDKLFPSARTIVWEEREIMTEEPPPPITEEELAAAAHRLKNGKAPGPDGIPHEVAKLAAEVCRREVLQVYDRVLRTGQYPKIWKKTKLVLLEKPRKEDDTERAYRPICLVDAMGKMLEAIIERRLNQEMDAGTPLSEHQYGFRRGRSAIDAMQRVRKTVARVTGGAAQHKGLCVLVTLDVRNAFNTARWPHIIEDLERRHISAYLIDVIKSYLNDRFLIAGTEERRINCGVPQGSILGPILWNAQYDGVFGVQLPANTELIGYADDIAILATAKREEELKLKAEIAVRKVTRWMESKGLEVAPEKTEVVVLAGRRKLKNVTINIKGREVASREAVKYLGVWFGRDLNFATHVKKTAERADQIARNLGRIMPSVGGPASSKRRMLYATVKSVILYAIPVWHHITEKAVHMKLLEKVHRRMLIGIAAAYRTTSTVALEVVAGIMPFDLQIRERLLVHEHVERQAAKNAMVRKWQNRWRRNRDKGLWTKSLIPDVDIWLNRNFGEVNHYITQAFTGHGCFRAYLYRIRIIDRPNCIYCDAEADDAEHTLFKCGRWDRKRVAAERAIGIQLTVGNIIDTMLHSRENWNIIADMIQAIMRRKLDDEKRDEPTD